MQTRNFQLDKSGRGLILGKVTMETHQEGIDEGIDEEALTEGGGTCLSGVAAWQKIQKFRFGLK